MGDGLNDRVERWREVERPASKVGRRGVRKARIRHGKMTIPRGGRKVAGGPQAASIMSGWRVMKIAQSLAARHLLKERTPLSPIPTTNPFNLEIINDRYALIILAPPWKPLRLESREYNRTFDVWNTFFFFFYRSFPRLYIYIYI